MLLTPPIYYYPSPLEAEEITCNTIVIDGPEKLIIDPGLLSRWPELEARLAADGFEPGGFKLALLTHSHRDHREAAEFLARDYGLPLVLHEAELAFMRSRGQDPGFFSPLKEGPFLFAGRSFFLYHAPGHSPGSLVLHWPEAGLLVTGDVYFSRTFGATDRIGGNEAEMFESLARLEKLPDVSLVLSGHGPVLSGRPAIEDNYTALRREIALKKAGLWGKIQTSPKTV